MFLTSLSLPPPSSLSLPLPLSFFKQLKDKGVNLAWQQITQRTPTYFYCHPYNFLNKPIEIKVRLLGKKGVKSILKSSNFLDLTSIIKSQTPREKKRMKKSISHFSLLDLNIITLFYSQTRHRKSFGHKMTKEFRKTRFRRQFNYEMEFLFFLNSGRRRKKRGKFIME